MQLGKILVQFSNYSFNIYMFLILYMFFFCLQVTNHPGWHLQLSCSNHCYSHYQLWTMQWYDIFKHVIFRDWRSVENPYEGGARCNCSSFNSSSYNWIYRWIYIHLHMLTNFAIVDIIYIYTVGKALIFLKSCVLAVSICIICPWP